MPARFARTLAGHERSALGNRRLGLLLAFVAGALNAGGFLAVGQYTSHVTGSLSVFSDQTVLGQAGLAVPALLAVLAFFAGAVSCTLLVLQGHRLGLRSAYALPLLLEATLILVFGLLGARLAEVQGLLLPATVLLLSFTMGLQNALITKASSAVVRTTHMTGVVTDLGIETARLLGGQASAESRTRLGLLMGLLLCFVGGGLAGALGFQHQGYAFTLPLAALLGGLALVPAWDDLRARYI